MTIRPDNFRADPLGYGGNTSGHIWMMVAFVYWLTVAWFHVAGEFPSKWLIGAAGAAAYLALELPQRGKLADTIEDLVVACLYGLGFTLASFDEVTPGSPVFTADLTGMMPLMAVITAHQAFGMALRWVQRRTSPPEGDD